MPETATSLGHAIFSGIEKDEYLNEIYDALLHNYFLKLFQIEGTGRKEVNTEDALRFADLLSKSTGTDHSEQHRSLAQELITLLAATEPADDQIRYVMGSVLSNTSNYLGLQHSVPGFAEVNVLDKLSEEISKDYLRIPSEKDSYFLRSQKAVFDHMAEDPFFSYSGPTSMGKSFVMRTFIREQIKKSQDKNYAIIVPTKALINEVSKELADDLGSLLREYDYRIVVSAGAVILQEKNAHHYVFVMTPERLMYQLIGYPDIAIHYLFVDEAQNIKNTEALERYFAQPMASTVLVMCHKNGKVDGRKSGYVKAIKSHGILFESMKLKDRELPGFIENYLKKRQIRIDAKSVQMIAENIGADLSRLTGELDKVIISLHEENRVVTPQVVEEQIGVSKEFNGFELRDAIVNRNVFKANQIIKYFDENPKAGSIYSFLPLLFNYFQNLMIAFYAPNNKSQEGVADWLEFKNPWQAKDYMTGMRNYSGMKVMQIISKMREIDAKSKGLDNPNTPAGELMKELIFYILH